MSTHRPGGQGRTLQESRQLVRTSVALYPVPENWPLPHGVFGKDTDFIYSWDKQVTLDLGGSHSTLAVHIQDGLYLF